MRRAGWDIRDNLVHPKFVPFSETGNRRAWSKGWLLATKAKPDTARRDRVPRGGEDMRATWTANANAGHSTFGAPAGCQVRPKRSGLPPLISFPKNAWMLPTAKNACGWGKLQVQGRRRDGGEELQQQYGTSEQTIRRTAQTLQRNRPDPIHRRLDSPVKPYAANTEVEKPENGHCRDARRDSDVVRWICQGGSFASAEWGQAKAIAVAVAGYGSGMWALTARHNKLRGTGQWAARRFNTFSLPPMRQ